MGAAPRVISTVRPVTAKMPPPTIPPMPIDSTLSVPILGFESITGGSGCLLVILNTIPGCGCPQRLIHGFENGYAFRFISINPITLNFLQDAG